MRRGGRKEKGGDDLDRPLLSGAGAGPVQGDVNDVVFGRDRRHSDKKREDMLEMKSMKSISTVTGAVPRRRGTDDGRSASPLAESQFVWHIMEPHHTLAGIALQYRVNTAQLMRFNQLGSEMEIYTLDKLKIPAKEFSVLLSNPEEFTSTEAGTKAGMLHTVALPRARSGSDFPTDRDRAGGDGVPPSIADIDNDNTAAPVTPTSSAQAFLRQFDTQMESAIIDLDKAITNTIANDDAPVHIRIARDETAWEVNIKDWRVSVVALCAVFLVSFSTYVLYHMVKPDDGKIPHGSQHYKDRTT